jgi:hypothetical protein
LDYPGGFQKHHNTGSTRCQKKHVEVDLLNYFNFPPVVSPHLWDMKTITETISQYVGAWDKQTPETVKSALETCCSPEITYTDKTTPLISGIDALAKLIMSSHEKFPGRTFSVLTEPEYFDGQCYYSWGANLPGIGERAGRDFIEYNNKNLITRIVGFLPA